MLVNIVKKIYAWITLKIKLWNMDSEWYSGFNSCFGLFPPSFYYRHSEDEIDKITNETLRKLQEMIVEYENKAR